MSDDSHPDQPARTAEPVRVARFELVEQAEPDVVVADFDGLDSPAAGRTRVAGFEGLDTDGGRPLAPVIRLDSVGSRRSSGAKGSDKAERPDVPVPTGDGPVDDEVGDAGIPPDGPLPRGRRKRARAGRLGPDAPDPELPLADADPVAIAREICLRLLTDRARTRQELAQALARKGVPDEAAAAVLERFAEVGLIDDAAFAGQWVRSRHTHRGLGRRAIAVELRRKGVAEGVAKEALAEVDPESEDRRARELVDRKLRSIAVGTPDQRTTAARRLVGMLARKGYGAGTAYRVVREALAEHGADSAEWAAEVHDE